MRDGKSYRSLLRELFLNRPREQSQCGHYLGWQNHLHCTGVGRRALHGGSGRDKSDVRCGDMLAVVSNYQQGLEWHASQSHAWRNHEFRTDRFQRVFVSRPETPDCWHGPLPTVEEEEYYATRFSLIKL